MRPPECALCGRTDEGTGLVGFRLDDAAREWHARARSEGFVGHPPDEEWFCSEHRPMAEALSHLTSSEALAALRAGKAGP